jgi:hypothetical protein
MASSRTIARCLILRTRGFKRLLPGSVLRRYRMHVLLALVPFCVGLVRFTHCPLESTSPIHDCVMLRIPFIIEGR